MQICFLQEAVIGHSAKLTVLYLASDTATAQLTLQIYIRRKCLE